MGRGGEIVGDKGGMVLTFQLHICQPDWRAESMSEETDLAADRGSCNRDRLLQSSSTLALLVVLANVQGSDALGNSPILETLASLRGPTNLKVSTTLHFDSIFSAVFSESACPTTVDLVLCFQKNT